MATHKGYSFRKRNENAYEIVVHHAGKPYYTTYHPPKDKKLSQSKLEQEIRSCALTYLDNLKQGYNPTKWKFADYADYVLKNMLSTGASKTTISTYYTLLDRINGYIGNAYLTDITPQLLNFTYQSLTKETKKNTTAIAKENLEELRKSKNLTFKQLQEMTTLSKNTVSIACKGKNNVALDTAQKIATALDVKVNDIFTINNSEEKLSQRTIAAHAALIGLILDNAEKELLVKYNAHSKSRTPKRGSKEADYFDTDEIIQILNFSSNEPLKWQLMLHLLIITGGRRGEIAGLKWKFIDLDEQVIKIDTALLYTKEDGTFENSTKTESGKRLISLPRKTIELLKEYKRWYLELQMLNGDRWHDTGYLFIQDNGKPMNPTSITSYCRKFGQKYGIEHCHPHKFRHSYASTLIMNNLDDVTLAKAMGHSRPSTTKNLYGHIMNRASEKTAAIISNAYFNSEAKNKNLG